jgi:26S proteasome regulatory subunit N1
METVTLAALSSSMIYVGTCNEDASATIVDRLMTSSPAELDQAISRLLTLSLGLIYLGKQDEAEGMMEVLKTIEHPLGSYALATLEGCAFAGTGNVLVIQKMLHLCAEHIEDEKLAVHQMAAVIGIALVAMGEEVGTQMVMRTFEHLLQYGEVN